MCPAKMRVYRRRGINAAVTFVVRARCSIESLDNNRLAALEGDELSIATVDAIDSGDVSGDGRRTTGKKRRGKGGLLEG
jgi:hypothetical protein